MLLKQYSMLTATCTLAWHYRFFPFTFPPQPIQKLLFFRFRKQCLQQTMGGTFRGKQSGSGRWVWKNPVGATALENGSGHISFPGKSKGKKTVHWLCQYIPSRSGFIYQFLKKLISICISAYVETDFLDFEYFLHFNRK